MDHSSSQEAKSAMDDGYIPIINNIRGYRCTTMQWGRGDSPFSIPLYPFGVTSDVRHEAFLYFVGRSGRNLQKDLAQRCGAEDVDVICCVTSTTGDSRDGLVR